MKEYINKMEPMFIEIEAILNTRTPKKGLGTRAEVSGITIEQHKILESMSWCLNKSGYFIDRKSVV
jgi:hypothetical protein